MAPDNQMSYAMNSASDEFPQTTAMPMKQMQRNLPADGQIRKDVDGLFCGVVRAPTSVIGLIAGRAERNFRDIECRHEGSKIEIIRNPTVNPRSVDAGKLGFEEWIDTMRCTHIMVSGPKMDVAEASMAELSTRVKDAIRRAPFTHFISLPFIEADNQEFITKVRNFRTNALRLTENNGIDESVLVDPTKLHFTLLMLRIYDKPTLDKVLNVMENFSKAIRTRSQGPSFPLRLTFTGTYVFENDKPEAAPILFTHAGAKGPVRETANVASTMNLTDDPTSDHVFTNPNLMNLGRALRAASGRLAPVVQAVQNRGNTAAADELNNTLQSLNNAQDLVRRLTPLAPARIGTSRPRSRDISTVSGPGVEDIFSMFERLVNEFTEQGVLTEEDKADRKILCDASGKLTKQSLTLHLTLASAKWRTPTRTSGAQRSSRGSRFAGPPPTMMDVSMLVNPNSPFGTATITQMHLNRRAPAPIVYHTEQTFELC